MYVQRCNVAPSLVLPCQRRGKSVSCGGIRCEIAATDSGSNLYLSAEDIAIRLI